MALRQTPGQPAGDQRSERPGERGRHVDPDRRLAGGQPEGAVEEQGLERGDAVAAERGDGRCCGVGPPGRLGGEFAEAFGEGHGRAANGAGRVGVAARRLLDREAQDEGDEEPWRADDEEGGAPAEGVGHRTADQVGQHRAHGHAHGVVAQRRGAPVRGIVVRDQRIGRRRAPRLADPHAHAAHQENPEAADGQARDGDLGGEAAERRHQRPQGHTDGDDRDPVAGLCELGQRDADDRIEQGETEAGQQAEGGVGDPEFGLHLGGHDREQAAVDEVQDVDDQECRQDVASVRLGLEAVDVAIGASRGRAHVVSSPPSRSAR